MNVLEAINTRRSIRDFTGEEVSQKQLEIMLKAGFQAPYAHNNEPQELIVINDKKQIDKIVAIHPYAKMLPAAGCAIIVCGNLEKESEEGFLSQDCSASTQNILLAAHGLGLGAVWCGVHPIAKLIDPISELLGLPEHIIPISMVVVGNTEKKPKEIDRYNQARVRFNQW